MKRILAFIILTLSFFTFNIIANDGSFNKKMQESLKKIVSIFPDETKVYPGHDNKTTIKEEKKYNPYLK